MENESKLNLQINLLDESYTFYNNSIENFDKDFPSNDTNIEKTTIFYENGKPINQNFEQNTIVNAKFKQFEKQYAKYNNELAKQIYINKVRSINCYFIDEENIDKIIHVLDSSSINLRNDGIIEKTIHFNFDKSNNNQSQEKPHFEIIFEINTQKNTIIVTKTKSENLTNLKNLNKKQTIDITTFTKEKLEKINYQPAIITEYKSQIDKLNNNINKSIYDTILLKNLIYNVVNDNLNNLNELIKINFGDINIKAPNTNAQNKNLHLVLFY